MFGLDIGVGFESSNSSGSNVSSLAIISETDASATTTTVIEVDSPQKEIKINGAIPTIDCQHTEKFLKSSLSTTSSAYPLLTSQFYSIYNILYSINDCAFEDVLIANTFTSLTKSRVDSLNFSFSGFNEDMHEKYSCAHDLLMRIDHLFRFMLKLIPKVRKNLPQHAVTQAIYFLYKYYTVLLDKSEKWIEIYATNFAFRLSSFAIAPRSIPMERIVLYLEWLCYLWAIMEFYAVQFERHFFGSEKDKTNPFHPYFEPPVNLFRPLECINRLLESVYRLPHSPLLAPTNLDDNFSMRNSSGRDSGLPEELNQYKIEHAPNGSNFSLIINFTNSA